MTSRICKFGCQTLLEGFDEQARKYIEAGTGGLHTKQRCEEAKANFTQKNDHGNELNLNLKQDTTKTVAEGGLKEFVDHTVPTKGYFKAFAAPTVDELNKVANGWLDTTPEIRYKQWGQLQVSKDGFAIALYYEECLP
jgi:hypothetical protein